VDYVYLWADGIHVNIRLEEHKLCLLVMIGVRADGRKAGMHKASKRPFMSPVQRACRVPHHESGGKSLLIGVALL
jgi:hypothetical protein